jgi:hypothetical protein
MTVSFLRNVLEACDCSRRTAVVDSTESQILELLGVSPVLRPSALHPPRQFQRARVIEMTLPVVRSGEEMQVREEELLVGERE